MEKYLIIFGFAFILTLILVRIALWIFPKIGFMDKPKKYGLKRDPIPYMGGIILFIVFIIGVLIFLPLDMKVIGVLVGAFLIAGISFLDDLKDISPWIRLSVQILAGIIIVYSGIGILSITNPLGGVIELGILASIFTIIWVLVIVNTMNFLDGINGLVSGVGVIASITIFALSIRPDNLVDQTLVSTLAILMAGMCLAFLLFDFYPARILMGDTGSMFIGFLLAVFAILSGGKIATAFLVLGFPILDAFWVIFRRLLTGRSPMKGDLKHLHHRLLDFGMGEKKTLLLIYLLCALFGGAAIFLGSRQKLYLIIAMALLMVFLGVFIVFSKKMKH